MFHWTFLWMELWKLLPFLMHLPLYLDIQLSPHRRLSFPITSITSFSVISPPLFLLQGRPHLPTAAATPLGSVLSSDFLTLCPGLGSHPHL